MKRLIALALAMMVASFGFITSADAATTWYVDDNSCPTGTGSKADPFCTINDAVAAANPGDTIRVRPGTYEEMVLIGKSLRVLGAQAGKSALKNRRTQRNESIVGDGTNGSDGPFRLAADNVTVDGFTARDAWTGNGNQANVWTDPAFSGYRILNNIIRGGSMGISLNSSGGAASLVRSNKIVNNNECFPVLPAVACASQGTGIYSDSNLDNVNITGNQLIHNPNTAITIIGAGGNTGVSITNNSIDSAIYLENTVARIVRNRLNNSNTHAIQLADNNDGTFISRNVITGAEWTGIRANTGNANLIVTRNVIKTVGIHGIFLGGLGGTTGSAFSLNTIRGATQRGILVEDGSAGNTFTKNTVTQSASNIDIEDQSTGAGTDGTDNNYDRNRCGASNPATICN
jgi:hypothetical protein